MAVHDDPRFAEAETDHDIATLFPITEVEVAQLRSVVGGDTYQTKALASLRSHGYSQQQCLHFAAMLSMSGLQLMATVGVEQQAKGCDAGCRIAPIPKNADAGGQRTKQLNLAVHFTDRTTALTIRQEATNAINKALRQAGIK